MKSIRVNWARYLNTAGCVKKTLINHCRHYVTLLIVAKESNNVTLKQ